MFAILYIDEAGAPDEAFEGHHGFEGRGHDHLKAELDEDIHGESGELVIGLVKRLVENEFF